MVGSIWKKVGVSDFMFHIQIVLKFKRTNLENV